MKPSAAWAPASAGVGGEVALEVLRPAERRVVEPVERRDRGEQRRERRGLAVVERDPDRGDAVVGGRREPRLARHEPLDRGHVPRPHRRDEVVGCGHQRSIPQTRSVTSFVNAASRWNVFGTPLLRSEKAIVPPSIRTV